MALTKTKNGTVIWYGVEVKTSSTSLSEVDEYSEVFQSQT